MREEMTPHQTIWDAKRKLGYDEPVPVDNGQLYVDTAPARGDFNLKRLYRDFSVDDLGQLHSPPRKKYLLFTGHRGCGKSTELLRVAKYLHDRQRFYVVHLDCLQRLDINNLKYSDVLVALAATLFARLEGEEGVVLEQVHLSRLENWFKQRVITHTHASQLLAELQAGAKVKTGLPWLGHLFAGLTNKISAGSTYRDEIRDAVRNDFNEFSEAFNLLLHAAEERLAKQGLGKRILFVVDGTDRLNTEDARRFFVEDVHQLTQIESLFIYCAPIHLLSQDNQLNANFGEPFRLPMLKIRDVADQPIAANVAIMRELALKRVAAALFDEPATLDKLIRYSGGHPRDLLRLLNVAINFADNERIDRTAADKAIRQVANDYRRLIDSADYRLLVSIDRDPLSPDSYTGEKTARMLYDLVLLEYNDYFWKSHPLITTLAGYQSAWAGN